MFVSKKKRKSVSKNVRIIYTNRKRREKFAWQRGYGAYSVSASQLDVIRNYIRNQDSHHKRKTFTEEYEEVEK